MFEEFKKSDKNKLDYSLIDVYFVEELAKVLQFGADKYGKNNWQNCDDITRYLNALERHFIEIKKGKFLDDESGLSHIAHLTANAMFLKYFLKA